jgi:hypothetical protein
MCVVWFAKLGDEIKVESSWNVMAHGDAREEKWRGNKRMEWVTSKRHVTAEHRLARAVQTLQADVHSSPASSRLNWPPTPRRFRPFHRKTKSGFCECAITFQTHSNTEAFSSASKAENAKHYQTNSFCLMVEALDHGYVLHTRRIYVFSINGG